MNNSLLQLSNLPDFSTFKNEDVGPAIEKVLKNAQTTLDSVTQLSTDELTWDNAAKAIEESLDDINSVWSTVSHLNAVKNTADLRKVYEENQQKLTSFYTQMGQNKALYKVFQALKNHESFEGYDQAQKRSVENSIRDFVLSGVSLGGEKADRYADICQRLSALSTQFSNNVLDATQAWTLTVESESELEGAPEFIISDAKARAEDKKESGYILSLDMPVYFAVMSQVKNEAVRKKMYEAYVTRASGINTDGQQDSESPLNNDVLISEILSLRKELAELLSFDNYAEYSLASKMADSPMQVITFLKDLAARAKPQAEKEFEALQNFAKEEFGKNTLHAWDVAYYSEQMKLKLHNVSQELLRPYFPADKVLDGLFQLVNRLYGIEIIESETSVSNEYVRFFEIKKEGEHIASFYLDLYAREGKRGGAWMADSRVKMQKKSESQSPVAFLVCNFSEPKDGKPAQLTHTEVTTLFHEFGHGLHHMLTNINVANVSGINGVEWDAVELPSQFMENFCWDPEVLSFISSHADSGEPLPKHLLDNMLAAKNFQSAMMTVRQIEFALFDMRIHMEFNNNDAEWVQNVLNDVREHVAVSVPPSYNRFQNTFGHIFAGGYAAGYYSYKWAELLSCDVFSLFEEKGVLNEEMGKKFLNDILSRGGSENAAVLFKRFRGREPKIDALLRHSGIAA